MPHDLPYGLINSHVLLQIFFFPSNLPAPQQMACYGVVHEGKELKEDDNMYKQLTPPRESIHIQIDFSDDFDLFAFRSARRDNALGYRCSFCTSELPVSSDYRGPHERSQGCQMCHSLSFGGYHAMEDTRC